MSQQSGTYGNDQASSQATNISFQSKKRFYDDANFPKGFRRSGDFTNKEAELLEQHGDAMQALAAGKRQPVTEEETHFIEVAQSNIPPNSLLEHIWIKYCKLAKGKPFYAVTGTVIVPTPAPETTIEIENIDEDDDLSVDNESDDNQ